MSLTRVSPALFQVSNNITSVTVGGSANTVSLTFDSNGVITGASNNALSVANTQITGLIQAAQIGSANATLVTSGTLPGARLPAGSVLQVGVATFDGYVSASVTGTVPTTITFGYQLFSLSFTPVSATSTILVQTSTVSAAETSNLCNLLWLALWDGSTFIAANSGSAPPTSFTGSLNAGYYTLNNSYPSGSTSTRTIQVRIGTDGGTQTILINGNANGDGAFTGSSARIQMTVWEIAA